MKLSNFLLIKLNIYMKKNLTIISFGAFLMLTAPVFSQEKGGREENFANIKSEITSSLNDEKYVLDQTISCVNSAGNQESIKKCHEIKRAGMDKIQEKHRQKKREHLQNELKKLDEKDSKASNKNKN